jgi:hypothetical protein
MPKFKLNEKVRFCPNMSFFGRSIKCASEEVTIVGIKGLTYKIRGYTGFWPESFFEKLED